MKLSHLDITNLKTYYKHIINMFEIRKLHQQIINFSKYAIELYMDKRILTVEVLISNIFKIIIIIYNCIYMHIYIYMYITY